MSTGGAIIHKSKGGTRGWIDAARATKSEEEERGSEAGLFVLFCTPIVPYTVVQFGFGPTLFGATNNFLGCTEKIWRR